MRASMTLHLNPPHAPAWPAAAPHRTRLPVSRIGARAPLTAQGTDIGAKSGSAAAHDCSEPPHGTKVRVGPAKRNVFTPPPTSVCTPSPPRTARNSREDG